MVYKKAPLLLEAGLYFDLIFLSSNSSSIDKGYNNDNDNDNNNNCCDILYAII